MRTTDVAPRRLRTAIPRDDDDDDDDDDDSTRPRHGTRPHPVRSRPAENNPKRRDPQTPRPARAPVAPPTTARPGIRAIWASRSSVTPRTAVRYDPDVPAPLTSSPRHGPRAGD